MPEPQGLLRLVREVASDQKAIWTSPIQSGVRHLPAWLGFGAATGSLIALDRRIERLLPKHGDQIPIARAASKVGTLYSVVPAAGLLVAAGKATGNSRLRAAGWLGLRAVLDSEVVAQTLKRAAERARPDKHRAPGRFGRGGRSFPSGHSMKCWALAAVASGQFPERKAVIAGTCAFAAGVTAGRLMARRHFPSDAFAGAALGWFIGRYVSGQGARIST
jgi:membrane-associated phospholipid phosphatase